MAQNDDADAKDAVPIGPGSPERPWIVTSQDKAAALPDGAWYVVMEAGGRAAGQPPRQKQAKPAPKA